MSDAILTVRLPYCSVHFLWHFALIAFLLLVSLSTYLSYEAQRCCWTPTVRCLITSPPDLLVEQETVKARQSVIRSGQ